MKRPHEQGMALLTTLMMVAVMSVLAVGVLDDIRFGVRRTANANQVGQAQWYALGAEQLAKARIAQLMRRPGDTTLAGDWNGRTFAFPVEGGTIRGRIEDGQSCFNLNSLGTGAFERVASPVGMRQFTTLLQTVGTPLGDAQALSQAAADWIDADNTPQGAGGAEDDTYARAARPYRTAGRLVEEVSELRAVRGVTPEIYARVRPFLCALPQDLADQYDLSPINLNTLTEAEAPLLTMLTDGVLPVEEARRWIARRPVTGWRDVTEAFSHPLLVETPPDPLVYSAAQSNRRNRFFALQVEVDYGGAEVVMSSLFEYAGDGSVRLRARRWTPEE